MSCNAFALCCCGFGGWVVVFGLALAISLGRMAWGGFVSLLFYVYGGMY